MCVAALLENYQTVLVGFTMGTLGGEWGGIAVLSWEQEIYACEEKISCKSCCPACAESPFSPSKWSFSQLTKQQLSASPAVANPKVLFQWLSRK